MTSNDRERATQLLATLASESPAKSQAAAELLPLLYDELKALARKRMGREAPGNTLQATALVHEAYVRLVGEHDPGWSGRGHFFGAAAEAMRRILVERARAKASVKRGAGVAPVELAEIATLDGEPNVDVLALDEVLARFAERDARKARVVELRYFAGLGLEEIAAVLDVSHATVKADWAFARAWLHRALAG